jgi:hypothetical protein
MAEEIMLSKVVGIRETGYDEKWLQEKISDDPSILGLGDLDFISKERKQSSGGRLDVLLKDPESDAMYEVELMLGATDETHIIRTIEYWDNERRKWPQREHFAVLVAETITRRFFNVVQLLSQSIPIIAIQVSLIDLGDRKVIHFSKVLDVYQEPEEEIPGSTEIYDESSWLRKASWTVNHVKKIKDLIETTKPGLQIRYVKNYVALTKNNNNYFGFHWRSNNKTQIDFRVTDETAEEAKALLEENEIQYIFRGQFIRFTFSEEIIQRKPDLFPKLYSFPEKYWK